MEDSERDGNTRPPDLPFEKPVCRSGQEATVRTGRGTTDWFQIGKGVCQGCILSPCLFNFFFFETYYLYLLVSMLNTYIA